jgi:hypothetical protein
MNVLYDISVLGLGHYHLSRAGIFRVVEEIARGLAKSENCDLTFCSTVSVDLNARSADYLSANEEFRTIPFVSQRRRTSFYANLSARLKAIDSKAKRSISERVLRKALVHSINLVESSLNTLPDVDVGNAQIFHSPHHRFPAALYRHKHVKRFITIYDLIPILFPHFFQFKGEHPVKALIDGINNEDWIICISECTKRDLCAYRPDIDPERVFVTPLAASNCFYLERDLQKIRQIKIGTAFRICLIF